MDEASRGKNRGKGSTHILQAFPLPLSLSHSQTHTLSSILHSLAIDAHRENVLSHSLSLSHAFNTGKVHRVPMRVRVREEMRDAGGDGESDGEWSC